MGKVLIVDRDDIFRDLASVWLRDAGHEVRNETDLTEGLKVLDTYQAEVVILDLSFLHSEPSDDLISKYISSSVSRRVLLTAYSLNPAQMPKFIQSGAFDVFQKPIRLKGGFTGEKELKQRVTSMVSRAISSIRRSISLGKTFRRDNIIGHSAALMSCLSALEEAAAGDDPILITGETGTGKELFAIAAHENSPRYKKHKEPLSLNCAAIPETLAESELFGYKEGAHDTAFKNKDGLVKVAHENTLILDEIGDVPLSIQVKLLRCLQEKTFIPSGATATESSDFRLVCATNQDLKRKIEKGQFRDDFYYRISGRTIHLPPLRARREDIREIAEYFIKRECEKRNIPVKKPNEEFVQALELHNWPGNIRELQYAVSSAVSKAADTEILDPYHLPRDIFACWISRRGHVIHEPSQTEQSEQWEEIAEELEEEEKERRRGPHQESLYEMDYETGVPTYFGSPSTESISPDMPMSNEPTTEIKITPEDIVSGRIKWRRIQKSKYQERVSLMVAACALWTRPQKDLAALLEVKADNLYRFLSTAKEKVHKGTLKIDDLIPHVSAKHQPALEAFIKEASPQKT